MIAIADEQALYLLEFVNRLGLEREIEKLQEKTRSTLVSGRTGPMDSIEKELRQYFEGKVGSFQTPIEMTGSSFEKQVWSELLKIPSGTTCSYSDIAQAIKKPQSARAVGRANGANQLAIVIPCHRVIGANGDLTGYGGGLARKRWLITHEEKLRSFA